MSEKLQFKISSALKDIIGRDLITDDYVAVFELVKNSFDAYATEVKISFKDIYTHKATIIIKDNGKGMNIDDLKNKWLFVAYSAKKDGTEDNNFEYRNRIYSNKPFAGAKGIGRFSCDRLGKELYLETRKLEADPKTEVLLTEWEKFEENVHDEFVNISVLHETKKESSYGLTSGTVLEISDLRSDWNRNKLLNLKDSLSKLINPYNDYNENKFTLLMDVPEEFERDINFTDYRKRVNGEIKNFVFETLELKTTKITSSIDNEGKLILSKLVDGGTNIYEIKQKNKFINIKNIEITLFYLNRAAKLAFNKKMGMASRRYGNVFLYKNGFRVYPFGEPFSDPMKIDERKSRKVKSRLGTGEIMGRIEITDLPNDTNKNPQYEFKESATRGDGLHKNEAYYELVKFFVSVLEKLEKYVVDVQQWGISIEDEDNLSVSSRIIDLISLLTNDDDIVDFNVSDNFLDLIEASQADSAETVVKNISRIANEIGNQNLLEIADKAVVKVKVLQEARIEALRQTEEALKIADKATFKLKSKITENLFLKSINTSDYQEVISLLHHVGIYAGTIDNHLKGLSLRVQNKIPLSNNELFNIIKQIGLDVKKISNIVTFATKAKFNLVTEETTVDLNSYIKEYVENIIPSITDAGLKIQFIDEAHEKYETKIKPIEMNIVIDNLVSNARKAKSTNLIVRTVYSHDTSFSVAFEDNGTGINQEYIDNIFNIGFTTTDGSGLGLFHVKEILSKLGAKILVVNNPQNGITFKITLEEKK